MFNPDLKTAWVMVPAIIGLILLFIGTVVTSIGLVRERETGTLEQLAVMPIKPSAVILGKQLPIFLLAALDMAVVTLLGMWLFGVPFNWQSTRLRVGRWAVPSSCSASECSSSISQTAGQAIQTAFMFLLPQILLSGMIFPLAAIPWAVRWIKALLPLTYFTMLSQGVMLRGSPISALWIPLLVLAVMAALVFAGAVIRFRRNLGPSHRQIERAAEATQNRVSGPQS